MEIYLEFKDVSKTFYSKKEMTEVLHNLSFSLSKDEIIAIVGPSGCGKSTILNLISGLIKPDKGQIIINKKIGYMFQDDLLFAWRTIFDNIMLGLELSHDKTLENKQYVRQLLDKYGLGNFTNYYPSEISGGMKKRVALIRTLAVKPELLLLDEPFSGLDYQTKLVVMDDIYRIIKSEKKSAIIVTHDINEALSFASKVIILSPRPSTIKKTIDINLGDDNISPLNAFKSPQFSSYFDLIYKEFDIHENT